MGGSLHVYFDNLQLNKEQAMFYNSRLFVLFFVFILTLLNVAGCDTVSENPTLEDDSAIGGVSESMQSESMGNLRTFSENAGQLHNELLQSLFSSGYESTHDIGSEQYFIELSEALNNELQSLDTELTIENDAIKVRQVGKVLHQSLGKPVMKAQEGLISQPAAINEINNNFNDIIEQEIGDESSFYSEMQRMPNDTSIGSASQYADYYKSGLQEAIDSEKLSRQEMLLAKASLDIVDHSETLWSSNFQTKEDTDGPTLNWDPLESGFLTYVADAEGGAIGTVIGGPFAGYVGAAAASG